MQITDAMVSTFAAAIANIGYPVGMGMEPHPETSRKILEAVIRSGQEEEAHASGLTPRMKERLDFIRGYCEENGGVSPSFQQIAKAMGLASRGGVARLVESLEERGFIKRTPGHARTITLTNGAAP